MAKALEACLFCGESPCVCGKPAAAAVKPKVAKLPVPPKADKPRTVRATPVPPRPNPALEAMRAAAAAAPPPPPAEKKVDQHDPEFAATVRALESIMHPDERRRYRTILKSEPTRAERAVTWKRKHREATGGNG